MVGDVAPARHRVVTMTDYLELEELLHIVNVAGLGPVRDLGLLASAVARPATTLMGQDAYPTLELKAAALLHSIVCNLALFDGNKRLGWITCIVFIGFNGARVTMTEDEVFDLTMAVASGELRDVPQIAARLRTEPREASGERTVPE